LCAEFALFIDGVQQDGTLRELFRGSNIQDDRARKHHTINFFAPDISDGIHDVSVKVRVKESVVINDAQNANNNKRYHKFIWVRSRVMKAEPFYL
jgi:hypothetical protein